MDQRPGGTDRQWVSARGARARVRRTRAGALKGRAGYMWYRAVYAFAGPRDTLTVLGINVDPEGIGPRQLRRMDVVDLDRDEEQGVVAYEVGQRRPASRKGAKQFHRLGRIVRPILADRPRKLLEEGFISAGEPGKHISLELFVAVPVELVNVIGDVQYAIRKSNEHRRNQERFRPGSLDRGEYLGEIIEPVGPIPVRGDDGLVLDCDPHFCDVRFALGVRFSNKQIDAPLPVARRGDVFPDMDDAILDVLPKDLARPLEVGDDSVGDQI